MKNILTLLCMLSVFSIFFISSCATTPPPIIPKDFFTEDHEISVEITQIKDDATMRDSGGGGIIGVIAKSVRAGNMEEIFAGIKGETVKELLRQQIENNLGEVFYIEDESEDLVLEVIITQWGWFLPTTAFGIKTGGYQLEISGQMAVYELNPTRKLLTKANISSQQPLGKEPTSEETNKALILAITDFSKKVSDFVLQNYY
jgi:hypothetical protein